MSRLSLFLVASAASLVCSSPVHAQAKDDFVKALLEFAEAAHGVSGDEGRSLLAALDAMTDGLGQWDAAIARMESGLASQLGAAAPSTAARMHAALGAAYLERGRLEDAQARFDAAIRLDSHVPDVHILKGVTAELAQQPGSAADAYSAAWERQRENVASAYLAFRAGQARGDVTLPSTAVDVLSDAVERQGDAGAPAVAFLTARLLNEDSVSVPLFLPATYSASLQQLASAKYDNAVAGLRSAAAVDPLVADPALRSPEARVGVAELRQRNAASAIVALTGALQQFPKSSEVHRLLGLAHSTVEQYDRSLTHLRLAVELRPHDERARLAMADVQLDADDPDGARQTLEDLTAAIPDSAEGHWKLGRLLQQLGDEEGALRSLQAASSLPMIAGASHVLAAIGRIQHNRLDLQAAAATYSRRTSLVPNSAAAHLDLGDIHRAQDALDAALAEYLIASLLEPANVRALTSAAQVHTAVGRDEAAVRLLRRAVALDPRHLEARYALSRSLLRVGSSEEAQKELQVFQQLQSKAMADERRRFEENQRKIDATLERSGGKESPR